MARRQTVLNPKNTFYAVKRFIGQLCWTQSGIKAFLILSAKTKQAASKSCPRLNKEFARKKLYAEKNWWRCQPLPGNGDGAVITVPAYFNDSQRQATRNAGRIAGLEVKRIQWANCCFFGLWIGSAWEPNDLGVWLWHDVSILEVGDGVFEVKSTSGDTQVVMILIEKSWLAGRAVSRAEEVDLRRDRQALQRLMEALKSKNWTERR